MGEAAAVGVGAGVVGALGVAVEVAPGLAVAPAVGPELGSARAEAVAGFGLGLDVAVPHAAATSMVARAMPANLRLICLAIRVTPRLAPEISLLGALRRLSICRRANSGPGGLLGMEVGPQRLFV